MWLRRAEVGPGYDRFAWLAHIRQIHGSRSRIVEIPFRLPLPASSGWYSVIRRYARRYLTGAHASSSSSSTAFAPRAGDLDGLSTGDLSTVYPIARTRESCGKSCNSVPRFDSTIPPSWCKSNVENRGTLIYGAETVFRLETVLRYEIKYRSCCSPVRVPFVSDNHRRVNHSGNWWMSYLAMRIPYVDCIDPFFFQAY